MIYNEFKNNIRLLMTTNRLLMITPADSSPPFLFPDAGKNVNQTLLSEKAVTDKKDLFSVYATTYLTLPSPLQHISSLVRFHRRRTRTIFHLLRDYSIQITVESSSSASGL